MTTGQPILDTVSLNGVTVDDYKIPVNGKTWRISSNRESAIIKIITLTLSRAVDSVLTMDETLNGSPIIIQRGEASATERYIFRGEVINVRMQGNRYIVTCADKLYQTTKNKITKTFNINVDTEAGVYSEIILTMLNDYAFLNADNTTVQDSGTLNTIKIFKCKSVSVFDRLKKIVDTIGWRIYYNPEDDYVYCEPQGFQNQTTTLQTGVNILNQPKWEYDASELYNKIEIRGAVQEVETTEDGQIGVTSGYTTSSVTLNFIPNSVKVYADAASPPTTLRTGGVTGSTTTYDYTVDSDERKIEWNTSQYTPGGSDYVSVPYSYLIPVPVVVDDPTSIENYAASLDDDGNPIPKEKVLHKYDIVDIDDVEAYVDQYLTDHKDPVATTVLKVTDVKDLEVGQLAPIIDTINNIAGYCYILSIKKSAPYRYDEITVADRILDENQYSWNVDQRIKRLEEEQQGDNELLLHVKALYRTFKYKRRYGYLESSAVISGGSPTRFVLGHPQAGVLGTSELGEDTPIVWSRVKITQGNNTYREFLDDTDFKDASTTATWTTATSILSFASGQVALMTRIALGTTYSYFTLSLGSVSGTLLVEISGDDGTTWQTVTLDVRTAFIVSDSSGVLVRITENAATSAILQPTYKNSGAFNNPAIKVFLEE